MPKLLLAALAALSPTLLADPLSVSIPNQNWKISFDAPALEKQRQQQDGPNFVFEGNAKKFNISIFVETPATPGGNSKDCFEHYWALGARNPIINKKSVKTSNTDTYYKVAYDMQVPNGKHPLVDRNANYFFAFNGKWVDVHISVVDPGKNDGAIFDTFDTTLKYAVAGAGGNANAAPVGGAAAGIAAPGAMGPQGVLTLNVPQGDALALRIPPGWRQQVVQPSPDLPPTVKLAPPDGAVSLQISFMADRNGMFASKESVEKAVTNMNEHYVGGSVEKRLNLTPLISKLGFGCYAEFTDASFPAGGVPPKGKYRNVASGVFVPGKEGAVFTLLSNETTSVAYLTALQFVTEGIGKK